MLIGCIQQEIVIAAATKKTPAEMTREKFWDQPIKSPSFAGTVQLLPAKKGRLCA